MSAMLLETRHLAKRLGDRLVLRDVSVTVAPGEAVAVVGPNGAGKSTLLKILAGVWRPSHGVLLRFGAPPGEDAADARIGYLGHRSLLYRMLSGYENLVFYARLYGVPRPQQRAEAVLRQVGLARFMHDPVRTYSRGMEQRAAIARLLLHGPELLLLDEPYTGLDPEARELLDGVIRDATERGGGVVLITHHLDEAARVGSRLSILWEGRLVVPPPDAVAIGAGADALAAAATFYEGLFRAHGRSRGTQGPPGPLHEAQRRRGT